MIMLAVFDSILIFLNFLMFAVPHYDEYFETAGNYIIKPVALPLAQTAMSGSVYSTMAIALERYLIACKPFYVISHKWSSKRYIIPVVLFSVIYNLPKFFEIKTGIMPMPNDDMSNQTISNNNTVKVEYFLEPTELRANATYYIAYTFWINLFVMGIFPFSVLIILNGLTLSSLVKQIRYMNTAHSSPTCNLLNTGNIPAPNSGVTSSSSQPFIGNSSINKREWQDLNDAGKRKKSDNRPHTTTPTETHLTKISMAIILVFIVCHGIRWIPNIYELIQISHPDFDDANFVWPHWIQSSANISQFMIVLNSSVNFYIYYASQLKGFSKWILCHDWRKKRGGKGLLQEGRGDRDGNNYAGMETDYTRASPFIARAHNVQSLASSTLNHPNEMEMKSILGGGGSGSGIGGCATETTST